MLRFGCPGSNLVASRAQTVRDFPSCSDIDFDLACFRVKRNGMTRLMIEEEESFLFAPVAAVQRSQRLVLLVIGQRSRSGGLQALPAICLCDAGEKNRIPDRR
jgi:hypothetical protein